MTNKVKNTLQWLRIYYGFSFLLFLLPFCCILSALSSFLFNTESTKDLQGIESVFIFGLFAFQLFVIAIFLALYLYAFFTIHIKKKYIWILNVILILFGLLSPITFLPGLFLIINYLSQDIQHYYKNSETKKTRTLNP